ncbi:helix-turn-helix domain-containing protein [Halovenus marina]|uniref:helix-turn-helix domain-containing protein n=1 Tax=Halovenus marina TaxID=3396621 RepID=UPI003F57C229
MIARLQFETAVLAETVRACGRDALDIDRLDGSEAVPLRTMVTTAGRPEQLRPAFARDSSVSCVTVFESTDGRHSYLAVHGEGSQAGAVYESLVAHGGVFVSGTVRDGAWELRVRFPDRGSFEAFRDDCPAEEANLDVEAVYETTASVRTKRCPLTEQQAELIRLAARAGYFEVPRKQSLGELATELDISTQAASERLRRGLDSLIDETLPREE